MNETLFQEKFNEKLKISCLSSAHANPSPNTLKRDLRWQNNFHYNQNIELLILERVRERLKRYDVRRMPFRCERIQLKRGIPAPPPKQRDYFVSQQEKGCPRGVVGQFRLIQVMFQRP
ncbi:hypothetical protein CEXT_235791 [Caerostris extrusa]|uniref:Ribosomal protein S14 n=1 Tax=Caerostris extrusa TaxID=172846 RepID=A0AAV4N4S7_CAEEX|nr:hypothetical protein CEXT_235791 [Caerostris extrusa]